MRSGLQLVILMLTFAGSLMAQERHVPVHTPAGQPSTWVPFSSIVLHDGVPVGRFWRDRNGSTRQEWDVPDAEGRTIEIHNIPAAKYYVYRPSEGWTVQRMVLPTGGWRPVAILELDAGVSSGESLDGISVREREVAGRRERRVPALNFFAISRALNDGATTESHERIQTDEPSEALFGPPRGVIVTELPTLGGIVAVPGRDR